jgi:hypothetical protein
MKKILFFATCLGLVFSIFCSAFAEELKSIQLPKPQVDGGRPLMQVLKDRGSSRSFSSESFLCKFFQICPPTQKATGL